MEGVLSAVDSAVLLAVPIGALLLLLMYIIKLLNADHDTDRLKTEKTTEHLEKKKESASKGKKKASESRWTGRSDKQGFTHPWLLTSLKGHTSQVLDMDFSSNGKYLASCGEDRAVVLWDIKDLKHKDHKSQRINIEFDYPVSVKWSPDTKAFLIHKYSANAVEVYKVEKKKDGWLGPVTKAFTFPKVHEEDVVGLGIACHGKFIMTCSNKTDLVIWDLRGGQLARVDTYLMSTSCAKISPCGRFIAASGFAPDVKIWEVLFSKSGEFQDVKRVFELTGHTSGVYDLAFDANTTYMATISKDGTWKLFDINVEYKKGEDPRLKITGKYKRTSRDPKIALSPNAEVLAIALSNSVAFYSTRTAELDEIIDNIFTGDITSILFDSTGKYLLVSGDKHIRVFHSVTGYHCGIVTAQEKLKQHQTSATKERLEQLICDNKAFLTRLGVKLKD